MGQLLQALLTQSDTPVQLRLIISQAVAPAAAYASIREYSDALGYFERPNRPRTLQALFARAAEAGVVTSSIGTLDNIAPLTDAPSAPGAPRPRAPRRGVRRAWQFAGAAGLVAVAATGVFAYMRVRNVAPQARTQMSDAATQVSHAIGRAVIGGVSSVTERLGLGRVVTGDAAPSPSPAPPAPPTTARPTVRRIAPLAGESFAAFDLEPSGPAAAATDPAARSSVAAAPADLQTETATVVPDATIYGPTSEGILPPVAILPQLPRELPPTLRSDGLGRIELIVAADGSVESVKLLGSPYNVQDAMLLSAAKAWRFQPALKSGQPVRFRKTIWIASQ
jgi:TonB family protein